MIVDTLSMYRSRIDKVTKFCMRFVCCRSIRVQIRIDTILVRDVPEGQQRISGFFATPIYDVDGTQDLDLQQVAAHLSKRLDDFNRHGSGFTLERITKFKICIAQYRPLHGSSYIATPPMAGKETCRYKC